MPDSWPPQTPVPSTLARSGQTLPVIGAIIAGSVTAGVMVPAIYFGGRYGVLDWRLLVVLTGILVGLAMRWIAPRGVGWLRWVAVGLSLLGMVGGYVWLDVWTFVPFMWPPLFSRSLSLLNVLLYAMGSLAAYSLAVRNPAGRQAG